MRYVDAHVHAFPDRLALAVRNSLNRNGVLTSSPLLPAVADALTNDGFASAWILPYAHREGVAESLNEWSATEVATIRTLVAGATFHPADPDIARLVERALRELGLRVVKLHCSVGRFSPVDPRLAPLWETASEMGVLVVTHAGQVAPGDTSAKELEDLSSVLTAYPRLRLVLAHTGHPATAAALDLMAAHNNLYADLTPVWSSPVALDRDALLRFPGRFLFGSDAPNCPIPASEQRERLDHMNLPAEILDGILGGNADALIPNH